MGKMGSDFDLARVESTALAGAEAEFKQLPADQLNVWAGWRGGDIMFDVDVGANVSTR